MNNTKKKIAALAAAGALLLSTAAAFAKVDRVAGWDVSGTYEIIVEYSGTDYPENWMT